MKFVLLSLGSAYAISESTKPDGTCGYQCVGDDDCSGCGDAGQCSCPDGQDVTFFQTSCSCVSVPADPPAEPESDVALSVWPAQWTASVDAWSYGDFSDTTGEAHGKFYYDEVRQRTRADWSPYTSGKDATQVWIADAAAGTSKYYVKTGAVCISFGITDPGIEGKPDVGMETSDWMKRCNDAGFAHFVGREQVQGEWADHWSCRLDYATANQSITFQNWHSLGLGQTPKGLPVRVTGGNSAPDAQKGSPRLNSVWYYDFDTSESSTKDEDFVKPSKFCIPVGETEAAAFFGHEVTLDHVFSPQFHKRAHHLPHAQPAIRDLQRARQPKPGRSFAGSDFGDAMQKLNAVLLVDPSLKTEACGNFSLPKLHEMQRIVFQARAPALDAIYRSEGDTRRMAHESMQALESEQSRMALLEPELLAKARDGACHELVMWYVHQLSESAREEVKARLVLPRLPEEMHATPVDDAHFVHERYTDQVSCAICHVAPAAVSV